MARVGSAADGDDTEGDAANDDSSVPSDAAASEVDMGVLEGDKSLLIRAT